MEHEKAARKLFRNYDIRCTLDLEKTQKYSFIEECEIFIAGLSKAYFEDTACKKGMNRGNSIFQTFNVETISGVRQDNFKRLARKIMSHDWIKFHIQRLIHWLFCSSDVHVLFFQIEDAACTTLRNVFTLWRNIIFIYWIKPCISRLKIW